MPNKTFVEIISWYQNLQHSQVFFMMIKNIGSLGGSLYIKSLIIKQEEQACC